MKTTDFSKYISEYLTSYLYSERGLSDNTIKSYSQTFVLFLEYLQQVEEVNIHKLLLKDINRDNVIRFLDWLQSERQCSNSTRNLRLSAIKSFFKFLSLKELSHLHEIQRILKIPKKKFITQGLNYLSISEIKLLLSKPDMSTRKGIRNLSLLSTMYYSGARVQEIADLTVSDLRLKKPYTLKLHGKGGKSRIVPLSEIQIKHLLQYVKIEKINTSIQKDSPLFYNSRKEKLTRAGVTYILDKYSELARMEDESFPKKISPHSLRHSKAMHLLQAGINIVYIRDILGHSSVTTTEIYAKADSKHKRIALEKANYDLNSEQESIWESNPSILNFIKSFQ